MRYVAELQLDQYLRDVIKMHGISSEFSLDNYSGKSNIGLREQLVLL